MERPATIPRLQAALVRFADAVATIPDAQVRELHRACSTLPGFVAQARAREPGLTDAQVATGLEQFVRELPGRIGALDAAWRGAVAQALHAALQAECPALVAQEARLLQAITARGAVQGGGERELVRYRIAVLEGEPVLGAELQALYHVLEAGDAGEGDSGTVP